MESPTEIIEESDSFGRVWLRQHGFDGHVAIEHRPHSSRSVSSTARSSSPRRCRISATSFFQFLLGRVHFLRVANALDEISDGVFESRDVLGDRRWCLSVRHKCLRENSKRDRGTIQPIAEPSSLIASWKKAIASRLCTTSNCDKTKTFRAWRHYQQQLPRTRSVTSPIREGGFEPPPPDSKSGSLPVSRFPSTLPPWLPPYPALRATLPIGEEGIVRDRGFEPRLPGWKPGVVPLDQSRGVASSGPRAEGEGVEPSRLIARPSSNRVPSPIGLPFL